MKKRRVFLGTVSVLCILFCLFLPFFFGLRFLLPILRTEETSSEVSEDVLTPDECTPLQAWQLCQSALAELGEFSTSTEGVIDTQILFFNYQQLINNSRVVTAEGVSVQQMNTGSLVNVGLQQYLDGEKAFLRPCEILGSGHMSWADTPIAVSMNAYYDAFGPAYDGLSAYLLNERTLETGFYLYENEGVYSFSFQLSAEAALYYGRSLRTLLQLEEDPVFKSVEINLDMDASFRPLRAEYKEEYTVYMDLIGETVCKSKYIETFSYETVAHIEEEFFGAFSHMNGEGKVPSLSTGYNFLFSLFGNSNTYDTTLTMSGEEIPLQISLETGDSSIYAVGEGFSLVYRDGKYYFAFSENKLSTDADAFNGKVSPLANIGSSSRRDGGGMSSSVGSLMDDVSIKNENGKLILSSASEEVSFRVVLDTASMTIEELTVDLSMAGTSGSLYMKQSNARSELPTLVGYEDITQGLDSLDILFEALQHPNTYYMVGITGEYEVSANAILSLGEKPALALKFLDESMPLSLFFAEDSAIAVLSDVAVHGSYAELEALLALFSQSRSVEYAAEGEMASGVRVSVEKNSMVVRFGEALVRFCGNSLVYENDSTVVVATKTGYGDHSADELPAVKHSVSAAELTAFLDGSVYPELLGAKSVYATLVVQSAQEKFNVDVVGSLESDLVLKFSTALSGEDIDLFYAADTMYLSHALFDGYLPADKLQLLSGGESAFRGSDVRAGNSLDLSSSSLEAIQVENHQMKLVFESFTLYLNKDSFRLVSGETIVRSTKLYGSQDGVSIDVPQKEKCIDLEDLLGKLSALAEKKEFAFTGNYYSDVVAVLINRFDIRLSEDGSLAQLAFESVFSNTISQPVKLYYDTSAVYADIGGIKLLSLFSDSPVSLVELSEESLGAAIFPLAGLSGDLSEIKSVSYKNGNLTVDTADGILSLSWLGDELNVVRLSSEAVSLLLVACDPRPVVMPSPEEYTDITELADMMQAVYNTLSAGSWRIDGSLDLRMFSFALNNVSVAGGLSYEGGALSGDLTFDIPYFLGLTSRDIPRRSEYGSLKDCTIINRVLIYNETIYLEKEIRGEYGSSRTEVLVLSEKRLITFEEFQRNPTSVIAYFFNLEEGIVSDETESPEHDTEIGDSDPFFSETPFEDIYEEDGHYVFVFSPEHLADPIDLLTLFVYTDGEYVTRVKAVSDISVFAVEVSAEVSDHGSVEIHVPDESVLKEFLPFQR